MRLTAVDPQAAALGLAVGSTLADAQAMLPDLVVQDHDPVADEELLDRIADGCVRYTPMVALDPPGGIMLDIGASAHLAGGEIPLARNIRQWLGERGMDVRIACASTAQAARALARFSAGNAADNADEACAVRNLPVAALELPPEHDLGLRRAGLKTIGDVADRPRGAIAARIGAATVFALELLIGQTEKPLSPRPLPAPRVVMRRFAEPIASKAYALKVLHELLEEVAEGLARDNLGGRCFAVSFHRVDGAVQHLRVETGLPTRDMQAVARLFDERMDVLSDPLDPGFGFDSIRLAVPRSDPLEPEQVGLEKGDGAHRNRGNVGEFLDRLAIRLGRNRVLRFRPNDTHIPERGQIAMAAANMGAGAQWLRAEPGEPPIRPLQLFDPPQRITVIAQIPDGPPRRFRWRRKSRDVVRHEGPERIAAEWWRGNDDGGADPLGRGQLSRDYYRIEDTQGRRYWVFRHGLYGRETVDPDWYLHGLFA